MNSSESPSEPPDPTQPQKVSGASPDKPNKQKPKWSLNEAAFNKLLECFSPNRDEASVQYDLARQKVVRYFECRSIGAAEGCADETIDRVTRRIDEGEKIDNLMAYIFGVARRVLREVLKEQRDRPIISLDDARPEWMQQKPPEVVDPDMRQICFDRCLEELGVDSRNLVLGYYEGKGRAKIDHRQELANKLKIPLNALRIRVHRIKRTLEDCIAECLKSAAARNG